MTTEMESRLSDEQAVGLMSSTILAVRGVMDMVQTAMKNVDATEADTVFARRVRSQRIRDEAVGAQPGNDNWVIRLHPLHSMWRCCLQRVRCWIGCSV